MSYGHRRPVLLKVQEPSLGMVQLGKITQVSTKAFVKWSYVNNISAEMRRTREFGIAPCVMRLLKDWDVDLICYWDEPQDTTWFTRPSLTEEGGQLKRYGDRSPYWYLHETKWGRWPGRVTSRYVPDGTYITLDWDVPEIAAWTLAQNASQLAML